MVNFQEIYVDGGCRGNGYPGAVGAAAACFMDRWGGHTDYTRKLSRDRYEPTSQRAEILAVILALEIARDKYRGVDVEIFMDSQYAHGCMTDWIYNWRENGWRNKAGNPIANQDLICKATDLSDILRREVAVEYTWIPRGENTIADRACNRALDSM